ncbi:hypothetical protein MPER_01900 [Moniliophthora perniciosa FA553]|nr:hypothetical protein MPER_01900 [Moniliophthora perniciosa FA553]
MYVFAWIVCRFQDGKEIADPPLKAWTEGSLENLRVTKRCWLEKTLKLTPQYGYIDDILYDLRDHVENGFHVKFKASEHTRRKRLDQLTGPNGQPFDDLTHDGNVTYSTFIAAFDQVL